MKTVFVDTDVILRYLTNDVALLAKRAKDWFQKAAKGKYNVLVLHITLVEALFLLEHWYKQEKRASIEQLLLFISPAWVIVPSKRAVEEALDVYKETTIDFVDLLTWTLAKEEGANIVSFDKHFDRLDPSVRVEP